MTNILILSLLIFKTNIFNSHTRDNSGCWDQSVSWNAQIKYVVPPTTSNYALVVEYRKFYLNAFEVPYNYSSYPSGVMPLYYCYTNTNNVRICETNGFFGAKYTELNTSPLPAIAPYTNFNGYFSNAISTKPVTNTIRFPIPPINAILLRLKKL